MDTHTQFRKRLMLLLAWFFTRNHAISDQAPQGQPAEPTSNNDTLIDLDSDYR